MFYSLAIYLYLLGIRVASLFNDKARQMCRGWRLTHSAERQAAAATAGRRVVWFHAASLGEFEQARPVIEAYRALNPAAFILLTFFSPSGYTLRHNYDKADQVLYLPIDTPRNARRFVQAFKPAEAYFVKYEFWYNYLRQLRIAGCRTVIFSAIFRPGQYFFGPFGGWFCRQLRECFAHLFVQNDESVQLLKSHGVEQCSVAGDTRFDRVHDIAAAARRFPEIEQFAGQAPVLMAGSSWEPDEELLLQYLDYCKTPHSQHDGCVELKLIIAPHVISESHLRAIEKLFAAYRCCRYTDLVEEYGNSNHASDSTIQPLCNKYDVLIINNMGMLSALYRYATVAYIGGGFGRGIHNTLEAVAFAKPVVFGPNHRKFQEAVQLLERRGGFAFSNIAELQNHLDRLFLDKECYDATCATCRKYMDENLGSTDAILSFKY